MIHSGLYFLFGPLLFRARCLLFQIFIFLMFLVFLRFSSIYQSTTYLGFMIHVDSSFSFISVLNLMSCCFGHATTCCDACCVPPEMPGIVALRERAGKDLPLKGAKIVGCTHINAQTAVSWGRRGEGRGWGGGIVVSRGSPRHWRTVKVSIELVY